MRLPLRVKRTPSGYVVEDAAGVKIAYIYCEADATRRSIVKQMTPDEAEAIAKRIARLLTDDKKAAATPKDEW